MEHLIDVTIENLYVEPQPHLIDPFRKLARELYELEKPIFKSVASVNVETASLQELVDLRRFLRSQEYFLDHEDEVLDALVSKTQTMMGAINSELPKLDASSPFTVPLINLMPNPGDLVGGLIGITYSEETDKLAIFTDVGGVIDNNINAAYKVNQDKPLKQKLPSVDEKAEEEDWGPEEIVQKILRNTPLEDTLRVPLALKFDHETRFSHIHIIGGSGAGKTQLLQNLILHDLEQDEPPTLIVVDSQGDLINKISRLEHFHPSYGKLEGKLTLISPRDINHPPAINIFDIRRDRIDSYSPAMREQVVAGVIQTFDYLFAGLLGADLTAKQSVFFRFVARLMLAIPETMGRNATILDMMNLMEDPGPYREAIKTLPPIQRNFFERDFQATSFKQTKEQIRYRLQAILENPTLERLFTSETTKIDLFSEMNNGGVILIDTAKDFLKGSSAHFGRIFISLVLQAALERASIPERARKPAFLIVDEAADYFDENIDDLLTQVRKYAVGCVFAHQFLDQCTPSLRASLAANTSTKLCASLSVSDARAMAPELRTTPEHILKQKKRHFSCFIRNVTPEAISVPVELGKLERQPRLDDEDYETLLSFNREKVSVAQVDEVEEEFEAAIEPEDIAPQKASPPNQKPPPEQKSAAPAAPKSPQSIDQPPKRSLPAAQQRPQPPPQRLAPSVTTKKHPASPPPKPVLPDDTPTEW